MPTTRISKSAKETLEKLARECGQTQQEILQAALESHRRNVFLSRLNAAFEELRRAPEEWQQELDERRAWDGTLSDDLDNE